MKKRLISVFAFALAVSAGAAFVLYQLISTKVSAGATAKPATKKVYVAAHDLDAGALITEHDITTEEYLTVPPGSITKKEDLLNRSSSGIIHRGAPFFTESLTPVGSGAGLVSLIPKGMRALAIKVDDVAGVAGFATPGAHVDVLVAGSDTGGGSTFEGGQQVSRTVLQNITVLSAGQNFQKDAEGKPIRVTVVNLLVTPAQAEMLSLAADMKLQLVLRNPMDQEVVNTPGAGVKSLFGGAPVATPVVSAPRKVVHQAATAATGTTGTAVASSKAPVIEVLAGSARTEVVFGAGVKQP